MVQLFKSLARGSEVILDIGANIGFTAILIGDLSSKVYAFEPSPTTFAILDKNVSRSGRDNIFLKNNGLGSESGEATLTFSPSNRAGGFVSNQTQASIGQTVEKIDILRPDEVVDSLNIQRIDFIKIDVEGFEEHVLRGARETLSHFRPLVVLELNHWCLNASQRTSIPDYFELLRSLFPVLLAVDHTGYLDLHDADDLYIVMYHHILHMRFPNIVDCFDEAWLKQFRLLYNRGFAA